MDNRKIEKIYVFGAGGMLGSYLCSYFRDCRAYHEVIGVGRNEFEVNELRQEEIRVLFATLQIDHSSVVINALGIIPQATSLSRVISLREYLMVNGFFPHYLAFACSEVGAHMFQISTDCVFTGKKSRTGNEGIYLENSICDEETAYGLSKSLGEPFTESCSVLRSSIIGEDPKHGRSLLQWAIGKGSDGQSINGYTNHFWNGITCLQVCHILHQVIEKELYWRGVRHFFSPECMSKFQLLSIIMEAYGLNCAVAPFPMPETIDKCLGSLYDLNEVMAIPTIREQIRELRKFQL